MRNQSGSSPAFGTLEWALAGDGHMTARERVREATRSATVLGPLMVARAATKLGIPAKNVVELDLDGLRFPDSKVAREAEQECRESVSPMLFNHSIRTYLFGLMLARRDGLKPDLEMFYVASLLHDLTLGETHRHYAPIDCFAARGGLLAREWTAERGWDEAQQHTVANAITMHLNAKVDPAFGPEAQLLQAGAGVDTIGLRHRRLAPPSVQQILDRYPRLGLKAAGPLSFDVEGRPGTRAAFLNRVGFRVLLRTAGFAE